MSSLENLYFADEEFCITLVSWPQKTATPKTKSVFLTLLPLKRRFSVPKESLS